MDKSSHKKPRGTGGTNDLFSRHIEIPKDSPIPHCSYKDQIWTYEASVNVEILNTFSHYMSGYLMIIKPPQMSELQNRFIEKHREWLSIKTKNTQFKPTVWDKNKKRMVENKITLYFEDSVYFALPRFYALALYGCDVWQTHIADINYVPKLELSITSIMMGHWTKRYAESINPSNHPEYTPQDYCPKLESLQTEYLPVVAPWMIDYSKDKIGTMTGELRFKGKLRSEPVDQYQLIAMIIKQWQRKRDGPPGMIASAATGLGKTLMALVAWLFMHHPHDQDFRTILNEPRKTGKGLFIVHGIQIMEQIMETIEAHMDGVRIGLTQGSIRADPTQCDIVIASSDTISSQKFHPSYWSHFQIVIMDEAHQNLAKHFQRAVFKMPIPYTLALTATPREWALPWVVGPVVFYRERPIMSQRVNMIINRSKNPPHQESVDKEGKLDFHKMTTKLVLDLNRSRWISQLAVQQAYPELVRNHDFRLLINKNLYRAMENDGDQPMSSHEPPLKKHKSSEPQNHVTVGEVLAKTKQFHDQIQNHKPLEVERVPRLLTAKQIHVENDDQKLRRRTLMLSISVQHLIIMQHILAQSWIDMSGDPTRYMIVRTFLRQIVVVDKTGMTDDHWKLVYYPSNQNQVVKFDDRFFEKWFQAHPEHSPECSKNFDDHLKKDSAADAMHQDMYSWTPIYGEIPGQDKDKRGSKVEKYLWKPVRMQEDNRPPLPIVTSIGLLVGLNYTVSNKMDHKCPISKHQCPKIGKLSRIEKNIARQSQFVMATWQIASVGMDEPGLDTLWELTPRNDIQQADGRIQRIMPDKQQVTKNEMVEPWSSVYRHMAMMHLKYYNLECRQVNYYTIDNKHSKLVNPH